MVSEYKTVEAARMERNARMLALHAQGLTQAEIAKRLGLTPEWVCKTLKRMRLEQSS